MKILKKTIYTTLLGGSLLIGASLFVNVIIDKSNTEIDLIEMYYLFLYTGLGMLIAAGTILSQFRRVVKLDEQLKKNDNQTD